MTDEPTELDHRHIGIDLFNGTWELIATLDDLATIPGQERFW
jgi:hypothetical protein